MNILKNIKNNLLLKAKTRPTRALVVGVIIGICVLGTIFPKTTVADFANVSNASYVAKTTNEAKQAIKTIKVIATAYSSTADQTDDTPFLTASGKNVKDGIIASNLLPFGTKVTIPKLYGDKIFTVEDRMNKRKGNYQVDIWMPSRSLALNFGAKNAEMEVLED